MNTKDFDDFKNIFINSNIQNEDDLLKQYYLYKISQLKSLLFQTDYKAIKYAEGWINEEEYLPIKEERQSYRDKINEYEELIKESESK